MITFSLLLVGRWGTAFRCWRALTSRSVTRLINHPQSILWLWYWPLIAPNCRSLNDDDANSLFPLSGSKKRREGEEKNCFHRVNGLASPRLVSSPTHSHSLLLTSITYGFSIHLTLLALSSPCFTSSFLRSLPLDRFTYPSLQSMFPSPQLLHQNFFVSIQKSCRFSIFFNEKIGALR